MPLNDFDVPAISAYVEEILKHCNVRHTPATAKAFVELALQRKERFHTMRFDNFGRREIQFTSTPEIILRDYKWFRMLLEEMDITTDKLTVMMGKIFVLTKRGGGAPLTKELSKKADQLFTNRKHWYNEYEYRDEVFGKPEVFLARLGDVVNLDKKAVISINPGDILRKSVNGKYAGYTSCHDLSRGQYRQGCINYCLDKTHIISYVTGSQDPTQKIHGRSMVVISDDMNVIGMRRFYPSPDVFGETRAKAIREKIHELIDPNGVWTKSKDSGLMKVTIANNGYLDAVAVATYKDPTKKMQNIELCKEVFCFSCGGLHTRQNIYCDVCQRKGIR